MSGKFSAISASHFPWKWHEDFRKRPSSEAVTVYSSIHDKNSICYEVFNFPPSLAPGLDKALLPEPVLTF